MPCTALWVPPRWTMGVRQLGNLQPCAYLQEALWCIDAALHQLLVVQVAENFLGTKNNMQKNLCAFDLVCWTLEFSFHQAKQTWLRGAVHNSTGVSHEGKGSNTHHRDRRVHSSATLEVGRFCLTCLLAEFLIHGLDRTKSKIGWKMARLMILTLKLSQKL